MGMFTKINSILSRGSFGRSVSMLVGGTAFAQAINLLALPVITRLYTPSEFNVLAIYVAILSMVSVVACLRLEIAIPMPKDDGVASGLLILSIVSSAIMAGGVAIFLMTFGNEIAGILNANDLRPFFWMLPVGVWIAGMYNAFQYWCTRRGDFKAIAQSRMTQSMGSIGIQLVLGIVGKFGPFGLLMGQMMMGGIGAVRLGRVTFKEASLIKGVIKWRDLRRTFGEYSNYPKYSSFEALANAGAIQLPVIIIGAAAIGPEAGFLLLAMKAAGVPMGLIGGAVVQVYLSRAGDEKRLGQLSEYTISTIIRLMILGVGPLLALGVISPVLMPLVFGSNWVRAGEMIGWMMPWFVMQLLVSPVSMSLHVNEKQRMALGLQVAGLVFRVGGTLLAAKYFIEYLVEIYAATGLVFYAVYFLVILRVTEIEFMRLFKRARKAVMIVLLWCAVGFLLKILTVHLLANRL